MIVVKHKSCKRENLLKEFPGALIFDVTSKGAMQKLSPFYPHGGIPIPFTNYATAKSVEGVWQGLKVFAKKGVDCDCFRNDTMKSLKRTTRSNGKCLGHQKGLNSKELLDYIEARKQIYIPTYKWMLENKCATIVSAISKASQERTVILLDYDTNEDVEDASKPLSHASLIKAYVEGRI
jgi:hypothetical protein